MSTSHTNALVGDYLQRLDRAAADLPRARRLELVEEIREHIDDGLREAGAADEVAVRNVLERLGPPEEIAAAAGGPAERRAGRLELAAMIALAIPFLGWFVGTVLLAASRAWTGREKAVAIAIALVPAVMLALGLAAATSSGTTVQIEPASGGVVVEEAGGSGLGPIELVVLFGTFLAGPLASVYLASRLRRSGEPGELASA